MRQKVWRHVVFSMITLLGMLGTGCKPGTPVADFYMDRVVGNVPLTVQFNDRSFVEKSTRITAWSWDFGDGQTSTQQNPSHTYTAIGVYIPSLTVTTNHGDSNSRASSVPITVSSASQVATPNLVGLTESAAIAALDAVGLSDGTPTTMASLTVPAGQIISQNPAAGTPVNPGSEVTFVISTGPSPIVIPNVIGMTENGARTTLTGAGLTEGSVVYAYSTTVPADQVFDQAPPYGAWVNPGTPVSYVLSLGSANAEMTILLPGDVPLVLVRIPAGDFSMGTPATERSRMDDESPVHTVTFGSDFYMGKYEITQEQWLAVMGSWPQDAPTSPYGMGNRYPAYYLSWADAWNFINAVNAHITNTGQGPATLRLPSEAEWEYSCRAGASTRFFFGDSLGCNDDAEDCATGGMTGSRSQYLWYLGDNTTPGVKQVGAKYANWFGLFDMSGNVLEWCEDDRHDDYTGAPTDGRAWSDSPRTTSRMARGGSWDDAIHYTRSGCRNPLLATTYFYSLGFRVACNAS